jgi:hypothetical protein
MPIKANRLRVSRPSRPSAASRDAGFEEFDRAGRRIDPHLDSLRKGPHGIGVPEDEARRDRDPAELAVASDDAYDGVVVARMVLDRQVRAAGRPTSNAAIL